MYATVSLFIPTFFPGALAYRDQFFSDFVGRPTATPTGHLRGMHVEFRDARILRWLDGKANENGCSVWTTTTTVVVLETNIWAKLEYVGGVLENLDVVGEGECYILYFIMYTAEREGRRFMDT